jgi:hypothetical protein
MALLLIFAYVVLLLGHPQAAFWALVLFVLLRVVLRRLERARTARNFRGVSRL